MLYEKELQALGLSEKEAKVYLAALELGPDTVQNIAKKAGINRPTAYLQIESLKQKGIISEVEKDSKVLIMAESPERLSSLLNTYEKELEFKKKELERILPNLSELFTGTGEKPKVKFYEGRGGIRAIEEDFLKTKSKEIYGFANADKVYELFPEYLKGYSSKRVAQGIKSQMIYNRQAGPLDKQDDEKMLRIAKHINYEKLPIDSDITIFGSKVAFLAYKDNPIGVLVESKEIAQTMQTLFKRIWESI